MEKATFGAGCFWGIESQFRQVEGVTSATVGYSGGALVNPSYEDVCSGETGNAEAVEVIFDPDVVFTHDSGQDAAARASKERLQTTIGPGREIVTEITPAAAFYRAEDYHQQYLEKSRGRRFF